MKNDHLINTVDELWSKVLFHLTHHGQFNNLIILVGHTLNHLAAEVASHNNHGVFKIHRAALAVS